ncbi:MAG: aldose 1-epimerase [Clostridia bacterium]|nr:aldose 1-epimerase [Clostridia bacterium]
MDIRTLRCGEYVAKINVSRGANCISLRHEGYGIRTLREPNYEQGLDNPYLYGMPVLFPVNRISGGRFCFEGREYRWPINESETGCCLHGDLHAMPFAVEYGNDRELVCAYRSLGEYMLFPHDFTLRIRYSLCNDGLLQTTELTNHSARRMPNFLGFHTTFNLRFTKDTQPGNVRVKAEVGEYVERNMENYLPTGRILLRDEITDQLNAGEFDPFSQRISRHYHSCGKGTMILTDTKNGLAIVYENDSRLAWRLIYNGQADEYICLEPQNCAVDCINAPYSAGFAKAPFVEPGETDIYHSHIKCIKKGETV